MTTVPVILLNYNSSADCRKCVGFLKLQKGVELEIIIVDNASDEADRKAVEALCAETGSTFLPVSSNRGYNAGNNVGLRYAAEKGYEYALIANPDMEFPDENYVAALVNELKMHPEAVVAGSDIVSPEGKHQSPMKRDGGWKSSFGWIKDITGKKTVSAEADDYIDNWPTSHYCSKVSGCCLLLSLPFIKSIGFFDENVFLYCEEAILSRQVENAGRKMFYTSNLQAIHRHISNAKGDPVKRFNHWRKSRLYYINIYSGDHFAGRLIASLSMWLYCALMKAYFKSKK